MYKKKKNVLISVSILILAFIVIFLSMNRNLLLHLKPAEMTYLNTVELSVGETKKIILFFNKAKTLLHWSDVIIHADIDVNDETTSFPENLITIQSNSSRAIGPQDKNQKTVLTISASNEITPGEYDVILRLSGAFFGDIAQVPLKLVISESYDDVIDTPDGFSYRSELQGQDYQVIGEKTVYLGDKQLPFTYRDSIDMRICGYKEIIIKTVPEKDNTYFKYSIIPVDDKQAESFASDFDICTRAYNNQSKSGSILLSVLSIKHIYSQIAKSYECAVKIETEDEIVGYAPLDICVYESPDDIVITPAGEMYRENDHLHQVSITIP